MTEEEDARLARMSDAQLFSAAGAAILRGDFEAPEVHAIESRIRGTTDEQDRRLAQLRLVVMIARHCGA